jgi:uncharacterized protein involved in exopolysaccharide biosynthesis
MNPSYLQTFHRHRLLFTLPVVITTLLALWFVAGTPKAYKATTSIWVDYPVPRASSLNEQNPALVTPATQAQQLLVELLATKSFRLEVGRKGPLTKYFSTHPSEGWGPTGVLRKVRGSRSVSDRVAAALDSKHVMTTVAGPRVVAVELHGPTPEVAVGTLDALLQAFNRQRGTLDVSREQMAMAHFKSQIDAATASIVQLNSKIARASGSELSRARVKGLVQARRIAEGRLTTATRGYNQASLSLAAAKVEQPTFDVLDAPGLPAPAVSGLKKSLFGVVAGIFIGVMISFLGIVLLTGSEARTERELREVIGRSEDAEPVPLDVDANSGSNGSSKEHVPRAKAEREG